MNVAHLDDGHVGLAELAQVDLEPGDFLILHSGRVARLGYGTAEYLQGGVRLADEVIDDLLQKGIHFIGIDGPGIRQGLEHTPADKRCESAGVYVIENLDSVTWLFENLRARGQQLLTVYTMWWEVKGSGIPCRVIAALDEA